MKKITSQEALEAAAKIKLLILDVDGVMTDGRIILDGLDNEYKAFNVRDGHGIKMLQRDGVQVAIITGRSSAVVQRRARELSIEIVRQGSKNKLIEYEEMLKSMELKSEEVAYVGDDIVDLPVMVRVGLSVAVANADSEVIARAGFVTENNSGDGAVREVTDLILKAQGKWDAIIKKYCQT